MFSQARVMIRDVAPGRDLAHEPDRVLKRVELVFAIQFPSLDTGERGKQRPNVLPVPQSSVDDRLDFGNRESGQRDR